MLEVRRMTYSFLMVPKPRKPKQTVPPAKQVAEKLGTADPSRAELHPTKRESGACRGPRLAGSDDKNKGLSMA
jgi:hypothetical protein